MSESEQLQAASVPLPWGNPPAVGPRLRERGRQSVPSVPVAGAPGAHIVSDPSVQERTDPGDRHRGGSKHAAAAAPHRHHPGGSG